MKILDPATAQMVREKGHPLHIAIVMDGNRRWAFGRGLDVSFSYTGVAAAIASCLSEAVVARVERLSFFALSSRNMKRDPNQVAILSDLHAWLWTPSVIAALDAANAQTTIVGQGHPLIDAQLERAGTWMKKPRDGLRVCFAVNYSSRNALSKGAPRDGQDSLPDVDLFIRTGGEQRLSDFLMLESSFAELVFTDTLWPDFTGLHLLSAISEYDSRTRRLGT